MSDSTERKADTAAQKHGAASANNGQTQRTANLRLGSLDPLGAMAATGSAVRAHHYERADEWKRAEWITKQILLMALARKPRGAA